MSKFFPAFVILFLVEMMFPQYSSAVIISVKKLKKGNKTLLLIGEAHCDGEFHNLEQPFIVKDKQDLKILYKFLEKYSTEKSILHIESNEEKMRRVLTNFRDRAQKLPYIGSNIRIFDFAHSHNYRYNKTEILLSDVRSPAVLQTLDFQIYLDDTIKMASKLFNLPFELSLLDPRFDDQMKQKMFLNHPVYSPIFKSSIFKLLKPLPIKLYYDDITQASISLAFGLPGLKRQFDLKFLVVDRYLEKYRTNSDTDTIRDVFWNLFLKEDSRSFHEFLDALTIISRIICDVGLYNRVNDSLLESDQVAALGGANHIQFLTRHFLNNEEFSIEDEAGSTLYTLNLEQLSRDEHAELCPKSELCRALGLDSGTITNSPDEEDEKRPSVLVGNVCHYCLKKPTKLSACSRCKTVSYCSQECQKNDWKDHKQTCKPKGK